MVGSGTFASLQTRPPFIKDVAELLHLCFSHSNIHPRVGKKNIPIAYHNEKQPIM